MQLVEQHCIDKRDPRYAVIDETAFQAKNLYNAALYIVRQSFIFEGKYLNYNKLDKLMKNHEAYKALPRKVSQWVLKGLHHNWLSFFEALKTYKEDPSKFTGHPKLPKYKHKTEGRNLLVYTDQAISKPELAKGSSNPHSLPSRSRPNSSTSSRYALCPGGGFTWSRWCMSENRSRQK